MEVVFIDGEEKLMSKLYKSKHQQRKYSIKYKYGFYVFGCILVFLNVFEG